MSPSAGAAASVVGAAVVGAVAEDDAAAEVGGTEDASVGGGVTSVKPKPAAECALSTGCTGRCRGTTKQLCFERSPP